MISIELRSDLVSGSNNSNLFGVPFLKISNLPPGAGNILDAFLSSKIETYSVSKLYNSIY